MATFLRAEWRKLLLLNYAVDPGMLKPYVPAKTELDTWNNTSYVSLVGFLFMNTRVLGMKIPFHVNFEEVNLRFYVRHKSDDAWRRGVVFIKEIVPRRALRWVANSVYGEHYQTLPMAHQWSSDNGALSVEYRWKLNGWHSIQVVAEDRLRPIAVGSEAEFITEHYWGYTQRSDVNTSAYGVTHPRWDEYPVQRHAIDVDFGRVYGQTFQFLGGENPASVFLAEGSPIKVMGGSRI